MTGHFPPALVQLVVKTPGRISNPKDLFKCPFLPGAPTLSAEACLRNQCAGALSRQTFANGKRHWQSYYPERPCSPDCEVGARIKARLPNFKPPRSRTFAEIAVLTRARFKDKACPYCSSRYMIDGGTHCGKANCRALARMVATAVEAIREAPARSVEPSSKGKSRVGASGSKTVRNGRRRFSCSVCGRGAYAEQCGLHSPKAVAHQRAASAAWNARVAAARAAKRAEIARRPCALCKQPIGDVVTRGDMVHCRRPECMSKRASAAARRSEARRKAA